MVILATVAGSRRESRTRPSRDRSQTSSSNRFAHYVTRPILNAGPLLFAGTVISVLAAAWLQRDEGYLAAETGLGYWLGIAGGVIMLALVAYPLRKRLAFLTRFGRVANWFRLHMILGIVGPSLVVLHSNFKLGSLNSRLALLTMLVVVASGIVGRYLYAKVHRGLYGQQAAARDVLADIAALKSSFEAAIGNDATIVAELERFAPTDDRGVATRPGLWRFASSFATSGVRTRASRKRLMGRAHAMLLSDARLSRSARRRILRQFRQHLRTFFAAVRKAERLAFFERVFGLWHHLHMPLFIMLAFTVTLHIIAVHRY